MKEQMHEILMNLNRGRIAVSEAQNQLLDLFSVSGSLLRSKAKEYAKFKHQDEYNDPVFHRDVLETLNDFEAGYNAVLKQLQ